MAQVRMDIEQVRGFGNDLKGRFAQQIQDIKNTVQSTSQSLDWEGSDAQQFKTSRTEQITSALDALTRQLDELGDVALRNAAEQDRTSNEI